MKIVKRLQFYIRRIYYSVFIHSQFGAFGKGSNIKSPLTLGNPENIFIGNNVTILYKCWLAARPQTGEAKPKLIVEDGCHIGNFCQIYATQSIHIKKNSGIASKVYIADNQHIYEDINISFMKQPIRQLKPVVIGESAWIGENVCIIGASIGNGSVIAANSVVTRDIPDFCVAAGSPARVIKRYNTKTTQWEKTNPDGSFKTM